jgi:hypothetical protein
MFYIPCGFPYLIMKDNVARMERNYGSHRSEFDYSWVNGVVKDIVSYYQTVVQLEEISWGVFGSWYLEGLKGMKRACSQFRRCGFITYDILKRELMLLILLLNLNSGTPSSKGGVLSVSSSLLMSPSKMLWYKWNISIPFSR